MTAKLSDLQLLERLVSFDTTSANSNVPLADFICDYLDHANVRIERNTNPDGQKVNLAVKVGASDARDGLILSGHVDTVPATEAEWKSDPFTLEEREGAYYARGSADMKGFDALAINTLRNLAESPLRSPLVLILSYDEEVGLLGAQHFVETWNHAFALPKRALVGEPTELCVVRMHKGHMTLRITLRGQSAHSAYPQLGRSTIEPAGRLVTALGRFRAQLEAEPLETSPFFPEAPFVTLNVGTIEGGSAINVIPDRCTLGIGVRILPGMSNPAFLDRLKEVIESTEDLGDYQLEVLNDGPPMLLEENAEIHQMLCEMIGQDHSLGVSYATDGGVLQKLDIDCVLFGPGSIEVAHKPNEHLPVEQFVRARDLLDRVVQKCCVA